MSNICSKVNEGSMSLTIVERITPLVEHPTRFLVLAPSEAVHAGFPSPLACV